MINIKIKNQGINNKEKNDKFRKYVLFIGVFLIAYLLLVTAMAPKQFNLKEGDIPRVDIKAPRDTIDEKATKEKENQAIEKVDKQYTLKNEVKNQAEENIKAVFDKIIEINESKKNVENSETEKDTDNIDSEKVLESNIEELRKISGVNLTSSQCKELLQIPKENVAGLEAKLIDVVNKTYEKNIYENDEEALKGARESASSEIDAMNLGNELSTTLKNIISSQINPNVFYDQEKTEEKIKEVQKNISKVIIKKNQIIVKEGEPVTEAQISILSDLGMLDDENAKDYIYVYLVLAIFLAVVLFLQFNYIYLNHKQIFKNTKKLILISTINIVSLILARTIGLVSPLLIPFACGPMLLTLLIDYKISLVISILNLILISGVSGFDIEVMIIGSISAILGATLLKKMQQRNELLYATIYIAIISAITTLSTGILVSSNIKDVLIKSAFAVIGGLFSGILALGILPFLEGTFNEVTTLKLLELSNPNNPLLKKLLMEAPGTYHHSMLVANLAEMAAEEVGANPVIARIGSYYHDVGKTERPYFFGENQMGGENPHSKITPNLSAFIIISHVKDGLELAKKYNLPTVIRDIIAEHHGTTLVKYFYYTMKNNSENPEDVNEDDYRYPGPIPSSKEAGVVMLADSTEAAVRSIKAPTKEKIKDMIDNIINDKLASGQLNNCDLTLKDIEKIRACFLTTLNGIYHQRIEYPKEKIKDLDKENNKQIDNQGEN